MKKSKIAFGKIGLSLGAKKETAVEASEVTNKDSGVGTFGTFGRIENESTTEEEKRPVIQEDSNPEISEMMGFSGFGKKSRKFDVEKLAEESRKEAEERNRINIEKMALHDEKTKDVKASKENGSTSQTEDEFIGPPMPPPINQNSKETEESDNDSDDEDGYKLPISLELSLNHGEKAISSVAMDPAGSRMVSGSIDYEVKYWDFQGMDASHNSFRSFVPHDGYPINSVDYSCTGDKILVVSGNNQAKVYDRDGIELFECNKGDMYIQDMARTKGHISSILSGCWHPKEKEEFMTCSRDGTCRLWHTSKPSCQKQVIKPRAVSGLKAKPTACCYSRDGLIVACATEDGTIQMWDHRKNYVNTIVNVRDCHVKGMPTSSICFSFDNKMYATRALDDTLKLWDIRKPKTPVFTATNLFNRFDMTGCVFSPNNQLVVTGTSMNKGETSGRVVMFNRNTWKMEHDMPVGSSHVVSLVWHPKLNQICVGSGDGSVRVLYDKELSRNGALLAAGKKHKRQRNQGVIASQQVITPHALPLFKEDWRKSTRKLDLKDRKDPMKSHRPDLPLGNAGTGGRVTAGGSTLSSYIIRNLGIQNKKIDDDGDPREALLKYAKLAEEDPYWIAPAYTATQPTPIFRELETDGDEQAKKKQKTS